MVDDGSTDETTALANQMAQDHPKVHITSYSPNRGKGYALRHGFAATQGNIVVFYDADLDIAPECIAPLVRQLEDDRLDVVVASKMHPDSQVSYPLLKRFYSRCYFLLVWLLLRIPVKDTQVGLKVFTSRVLHKVLPFPQVNGFAFDVELLALVQRAGYRIGEGPVKLDYNGSNSSVSLTAIMRALADTFGVFYRTRLRRGSTVNDQR